MTRLVTSELSPPSAAYALRLIWDWPVRVLHWLLVTGFCIAWLTAESEHWRALHAASGYGAGVAILLRIVWGLAGSRHARFAAFVRAPQAAWSYLRSLAAGRAAHFPGHNPAGGWAIIGILAAGTLTVVSGWLTINEFMNGKWHDRAATAWLLIVSVHLCGVVIGSLAHRENLVAAMFTGVKRAAPDQAVRSAHPWLGVLAVLLTLAMSGLALAGYF